jgi:hypothetical protein
MKESFAKRRSGFTQNVETSDIELKEIKFAKTMLSPCSYCILYCTLSLWQVASLYASTFLGSAI